MSGARDVEDCETLRLVVAVADSRVPREVTCAQVLREVGIDPAGASCGDRKETCGWYLVQLLRRLVGELREAGALPPRWRA